MASIFAIRDDDTSFFTQPAKLEAVYAPYWGKTPVSLAVVPYSVPDHRGRSFDSDCPADMQMPLEANKELVAWLRNRIVAHQVEIMLHGYNHQYRKIKGKWVGEFGWKPRDQLVKEVAGGKSYLESLLNTRIRVFVPPSNTIGTDGIHAIRNSALNLSGVMGRGGDRPWSWDYPMAYARRWQWRLVNGSPYPYPLRYGGHTELCAHALTPRASAEGLMRSLEACAKIGAPFVLATHYWEFQEVPQMHKILARLGDRASELGMSYGTVSECIGGNNES